MFDHTADSRARRMGEIGRASGRPAVDIHTGRWGWDDGVQVPPDLASRRHLLADLTEEQKLYAEGHGIPALGGSCGQRLINSATWKAYRGSDTNAMEYSPEGVTIMVATADELPWLATTLSFPSARTRAVELATKPRFSPLDFFSVIPVDTRQQYAVGIASDEPVGFGLNGTASSPEITVTASAGDRDLIRWAGHANARRSLLTDSDTTSQRLIDEVLARAWFRALALEVLTGDASVVVNGRQQLRGIANVVGIGTTAVATGDYTAALLAAIRIVEAAGFPGPHVAIFNPVDKAKVLGHTAFRADRFPTLEGIVGFDKIAATKGFVGQVGAGRLFSTGLAIEVSPSHGTDLTEGLITLQPLGWLDADVPYPGAFATITGI